MAEPRHLTQARHVAADRVPTLTEVVELDVDSARADVQLLQRPAEPAAAADELSAEVLFELEQCIDSLLEWQLREALAPALARVADGLIREARQELSGVLRELVKDAVARALERRKHLQEPTL